MVGPTVASSHNKETTAKKDEFNYPGGEARISSDFDLIRRFGNIVHPLESEWNGNILEDLRSLTGSAFEREAAKCAAERAMYSIIVGGSFLDTFKYNMGRVTDEYGTHTVDFVLNALRKLGVGEGA